MPVARFQMPDGRIGRFEVPEGTTPEQAQSMISAAISGQSVAPETPREQPAALTRTEKFIKGLRDPIDGAAQLLTHMLPEGVVQAGDRMNNWLADNTGLVGHLPEQNLSSLVTGQKSGVDRLIEQNEKAYQAARQAQGESGIDGYRILGNFLNPANLAVAARIPQAATLAGRIGIGAVSGAGYGALTPVGEGDFATEKAKQMAAGTIMGGSIPMLTGAAARIISPNASTNPSVRLLKAEGVNPTIGQTLGGWANRLEEKAQSLPILGDAIMAARRQALGEFNQAAINRAAGKVGAEVDQTGQAGIREAGDAISDFYNQALSQVNHVTFDGQFNASLGQLRNMAQSLTPDMARKFDKTLRDVVLTRVSPNGSMLGQTYKTADSELGNIAARYSKSSVASEQEFGDAVKQLQALMNDQMRCSNPQVADMLNQADAAWANLVRLEGAGKAAKNAEGVFTPGQLNQAIQGADKSARGRSVARGDALMQDLGNAGQAVLGNKVPNSFTTDRALIAGGALGSYFVNPAIPMGLLGGAATYTPLGQRLLTAIVASRPDLAQPLAKGVRKATPALLPGGSQLGLGLLNQ